MIPLFTSEQVRSADKFAIETLNIPSIVLMENASLSIYNSVRANFPDLNEFQPIGILCGKGNNGGDGLALARHFINNGFDVVVLILTEGKNLPLDAKTNFHIFNELLKSSESSGILQYKTQKDLKYLSNCQLIIDALLGTGAKGKLRSPYSEIINYVNGLNAYKVAVDIPSGLNADTGCGDLIFDADLTVTLADFKRGLFFEKGYKHSGDVVLGSIGIGNKYFNELNTEDYLIEPEDCLEAFSLRDADLHKYTSGKVLTIAGSGNLPGAAFLASEAVLKVGAGASILAFPKSIKSIAQSRLKSVVVHSYEDANREHLSLANVEELLSRIEWADVISVGSGLGRDKETLKAVRAILSDQSEKYFILDADAVYALGSNEYKKIDLSKSILTPHQGEFSAMLGISLSVLKEDILRYGKDFSISNNTVLVLKGAPTIVFTPKGEALINTSGNSGLAKFGSGDVLTGVISGILAQCNNPELAAVAGVYLHGLAADLLREEFTEFGITAENVLDKIPSTISFLGNSCE